MQPHLETLELQQCLRIDLVGHHSGNERRVLRVKLLEQLRRRGLREHAHRSAFDDGTELVGRAGQLQPRLDELDA